MHHVSLSIGNNLYLEVFGIFLEFFDKDLVATECHECLALAGVEAGGYLGDIAYDACF